MVSDDKDYKDSDTNAKMIFEGGKNLDPVTKKLQIKEGAPSETFNQAKYETPAVVGTYNIDTIAIPEGQTLDLQHISVNANLSVRINIKIGATLIDTFFFSAAGEIHKDGTKESPLIKRVGGAGGSILSIEVVDALITTGYVPAVYGYSVSGTLA